MGRADHLGSGGPAAYFLTFSCYGSRLHGDERGTVRREHNIRGTPFYAADERLAEAEHAQLKADPFMLDAARRECVASEVRRTASLREWPVHAMNVRTTHVHVVLSAPQLTPERVMNDLKAWATTRLRRSGLADADQPVWSRHGSTIYVWRDDDVPDVCWYVHQRQGEWIAGCGAPPPSLNADHPSSYNQPLAGARGTDPRAGLCAVCRRSRLVRSGKGSVFWMCELSKTDPQFPRYPPLPVLECAGFEAG